MSVCNKVQSFLRTQLEKNNLKRIDVARDTGIASYTVHTLFNGSQNDVTLKTILRLANYFNCTTDEVLGRKKFQIAEKIEYNAVDPQVAMEKIKDFIKIKMNEINIDVTKFAKKCGLDRGALRGFVEGNERHKTIKSNSILAIADAFNVSLDELIERVEVNHVQLES